MGLYHLLNVPNKSAYAYFLVALVEFSDREEDLVYTFIGYDGEDCVIHLRPCVGSAMGVAGGVAASLYVLPKGEATDAKGVEHVLYTLGAGLVINYKDRFHIS